MKNRPKFTPDQYPANLRRAVFGDDHPEGTGSSGLMAAMATLTEVEESCLILRFAVNQSFSAIGERHGLSKKEARETIGRAIRKLRHPSRRNMTKTPCNQKEGN
jgi:DNA-directed RNA polymerase specialized sigma24 family protein